MVTTHKEKSEILRDILGGTCFPMVEPWDLSSANALEARGFSTLHVRPWAAAGVSTVREQIDLAADFCSQAGVPVIAELRAVDCSIPANLDAAVERLTEAGAAGIAIAAEKAHPTATLDALRDCRALLDQQGAPQLLFLVAGYQREEGRSAALLFARSGIRAGADGLIMDGMRSVPEIAKFARLIAPASLIVQLNDHDMSRIADFAATGVRGVLASGMLAFSVLAGDEEAVYRLSNETAIGVAS